MAWTGTLIIGLLCMMLMRLLKSISSTPVCTNKKPRRNDWTEHECGVRGRRILAARWLGKRKYCRISVKRHRTASSFVRGAVNLCIERPPPSELLITCSFHFSLSLNSPFCLPLSALLVQPLYQLSFLGNVLLVSTVSSLLCRTNKSTCFSCTHCKKRYCGTTLHK